MLTSFSSQKGAITGSSCWSKMEGRLESSPLFCTPRPLPDFSAESPFSRRKKTPFRVPHSPLTCPPVSRIRHLRVQSCPGGPKAVTFKSEGKADVLQSPYYSAQSKKSYLEQCFHVVEKLGEGSFGVVYRARSRDDGEMYAIKISRQPFRGSKDRRLKLAEVEKHQRLPHHPNCIKFYKAWEENQKLYIQTELCQMSLAEYADVYGKVPEDTVWRMLFDLTKGLKHLHDHQLCHFDIKPANVFLGADQRSKLGDFGLCSSLEQGCAEAMEGDAIYLAPELLRNQFGKPADIFSLGISLLELACDVELPSGGEKWHLLRKGQIPRKVTAGLSDELVEVLSQMMHPNPSERPTVDMLLNHECVKLASSHSSCYQTLKESRQIESSPLKELRGVDSSPVLKRLGVPEEDMDCEPQCNDSFNRSWIRTSPMRYPSGPLYSGPPIPLDLSFDEDSSPDRCSLSKRVPTSSPTYTSSPSYSPTSYTGGQQAAAKLMEPKKILFHD